MIYTDNAQVRKEFKKLVIRENLTMTTVAEIAGISPQQLYNRFANDRLAFSDVKKFLNHIGYELELNFVKKDC